MISHARRASVECRNRSLRTRGEAPVLAFDDVLLAGLARDGGLYVPESWPQVSGPRSGGRCRACPMANSPTG
jgi:threonine synthase